MYEAQFVRQLSAESNILRTACSTDEFSQTLNRFFSFSHVAVSFPRINSDHRAQSLQSITSSKQLLKKLEGKVRGLIVHRTQQTGRRIIAGRPRARSARIYFNRKEDTGPQTPCSCRASLQKSSQSCFLLRCSLSSTPFAFRSLRVTFVQTFETVWYYLFVS